VLSRQPLERGKRARGEKERGGRWRRPGRNESKILVERERGRETREKGGLGGVEEDGREKRVEREGRQAVTHAPERITYLGKAGGGYIPR